MNNVPPTRTQTITVSSTPAPVQIPRVQPTGSTRISPGSGHILQPQPWTVRSFFRNLFRTQPETQEERQARQHPAMMAGRERLFEQIENARPNSLPPPAVRNQPLQRYAGTPTPVSHAPVPSTRQENGPSTESMLLSVLEPRGNNFGEYDQGAAETEARRAADDAAYNARRAFERDQRAAAACMRVTNIENTLAELINNPQRPDDDTTINNCDTSETDAASGPFYSMLSPIPSSLTTNTLFSMNFYQQFDYTDVYIGKYEDGTPFLYLEFPTSREHRRFLECHELANPSSIFPIVSERTIQGEDQSISDITQRVDALAIINEPTPPESISDIPQSVDALAIPNDPTPAEPTSITINVKNIIGQIVNLQVPPNSTVEDINNALEETTGHRAKTLIYKGKRIEEASHIFRYNISDGATIFETSRLVGGGPGQRGFKKTASNKRKRAPSPSSSKTVAKKSKTTTTVDNDTVIAAANIEDSVQRQMHTQFLNGLARQDLTIHTVDKDGSCFFHALLVNPDVQAAYPDASTLRQRLADYLEANRDPYLEFIVPDVGELAEDAFTRHIAALRNETTWGGNFELRAMADMIGLPIHLYQVDGDGTAPFQVFNGEADGSPVRIVYRGNHYDAIVVDHEGIRSSRRNQKSADKVTINRPEVLQQIADYKKQLLSLYQAGSHTEEDQKKHATITDELTTLAEKLVSMIADSAKPSSTTAPSSALSDDDALSEDEFIVTNDNRIGGIRLVNTDRSFVPQPAENAYTNRPQHEAFLKRMLKRFPDAVGYRTHHVYILFDLKTRAIVYIGTTGHSLAQRQRNRNNCRHSGYLKSLPIIPLFLRDINAGNGYEYERFLIIYAKKYLKYPLANEEFAPPTDPELVRLLDHLPDDEREQLNAEVKALFDDAIARYLANENYSQDAEFIEYRCAVCNEPFDYPDSRDRHHKHDHTDAQRFACPESDCGETFKYESGRDRHVEEIHRNPQEIPCPEPDCTKTFSRQENLDRHLEEKHRNPQEIPCPEPDCKKTFSRQEHLDCHIEEIHRNPQEIPCPEPDCTKTFSRQETLDRHLEEKHRNPQKIPCPDPDCKKTFSRQENLDCHIEEIHLNPQWWYCTVPGCTKKFTTKRSRDRHVKKDSHSFPCVEPKCTEAFPTSDARLQHVDRDHPNPRRFYCREPGCGGDLSSKSGLTKHTKKMHPKQ